MTSSTIKLYEFLPKIAQQPFRYPDIAVKNISSFTLNDITRETYRHVKGQFTHQTYGLNR